MPASSSRRRSSNRSHSSSRSRSSRSPKPRRRVSRRVWIGIGVLAGAVLVVLGWMAYEASQAQRALAHATDEAQTLQDLITEGDTEQAQRILTKLQGSTTTARTRTDGPLWDAGAAVPLVGNNIAAVQTASASLDDIAQRALPPIVETSTSLDADVFRPEDGVFPLETFATLAPNINTAASVLTQNRREIDAIKTTALLGSIGDSVAELQDKIGTAEYAAASASRTLRLAPQMLGADGKRTFLLLFQNNAEARSSGGIVGAFALVTADDGELSFDEQLTIRDLDRFREPVVKLTDNEKTTYDPLLAQDIRNVTYTPDFPRTATIARTMVEESLDVDIDGVLSIDPVALSFMLRGTGPVKVSDDVTLTSGNAAETLLNTVYARFRDPEEQDTFFADAAQTVFDAALSGKGDIRKTLLALREATSERRLMLWFADDEAEAVLDDTRLNGKLPGESTTPHVGVYLNDATASKMQWYLTTENEVESTGCTDDGVQSFTVTTTLTSTAPADAAELPEYITGSIRERVSPGDQQVSVRVFAPWGGELQELQVDGKRSIFGVGRSGERPVLTTSVLLAPGESVTLVSTITSGADQRDDAVLTQTPGVRPLDQDRRIDSACR